MSVPAFAQQQPPRADDDRSADVVVTAQKREQRALDVPMSVTALSANDLVDNNQTSIEEYFRSVPGLSLSSLGSGRYNLSIRGVTTGISTNPTVGITIDDVPYGSISILGFGSRIFPDLDPSDLQRIEVLRGPQGTLYGASSLGGLLKYVTADPSTTRTFGRIQADGSVISHGGAGGGLRGSVNIPVVADTLGIRASAFYKHDGGYVDDPGQGRKDVDRSDAYGGRLSALWTMAPNVSLKLGALYEYNKGGSDQIDADYLLRPKFGALAHHQLAGTGRYFNEAQFYTADLKVGLGSNVTLNALTGYSVNEYETVQDQTRGYGPYAALVYNVTGAPVPFNFLTRKFSQELRLSSAGTTIDWLIGGFYTREKSKDYFTGYGTDEATGRNAGILFDEHDRFAYSEYAGFGDVTLHVAPRVDIQAGGRLAHNKQDYRSIVDVPVPAQDIFGPSTDFSEVSADSAFTFEVGPSFKISPDVMLYARLSSGYRPGGPNAGYFGPSTPRTFGADKTKNYELGIKGSVLNRMLTFEAAVYTLDWSNIQLSFHDATTGFLYLKNASKATSRGIEGSFDLRPSHDLTISGNLSVNSAKLAADLPTDGSYGVKGDVLPNVPKFSATLSAEQRYPLGNGSEAFIGGSLSHVGTRKAEFVGTASEIRVDLPAYTTGDLRLGVRSGNLTVTAFGTNLTDSRGVLYAGPLSGRARTTSFFYKTIVKPRTFGLSVAREF